MAGYLPDTPPFSGRHHPLSPIALFQQLVDKKLLPPQGMLDFLIFQVMIVLFGAALLAWWFVFTCLRNDKFVKPPLDQATLDFYDTTGLIDIYYAMAKGRGGSANSDGRMSGFRA